MAGKGKCDDDDEDGKEERRATQLRHFVSSDRFNRIAERRGEKERGDSSRSISAGGCSLAPEKWRHGKSRVRIILKCLMQTCKYAGTKTCLEIRFGGG